MIHGKWCVMKRFAVIGNPIEQSKSPIIHQHFAEQFKIDLEYNKILATEHNFKTIVTDFFRTGGSGLNITAPFKELAFQLAHKVSSQAKKAQAVNTLVWKDGELFGDTTDGRGLINDFAHLNVTLQNQKILLIGAGGAGRGAIASLLAAKPKELIVANRTYAKVENMLPEFDHKFTGCDFNNIPNDCDIVINSTSCSLYNETPDIDESLLKNIKYSYDMSYKKETTSFNQWIENISGAQLSDGLGMLVEQAAESFNIWHGQMPDTNEIRNQLRQ